MNFAFPAAVSLIDGGLLALVFALAALIGGISGFGFPAIGAISLTFMPSTTVVPLLMVLSVANQVLSLSTEVKVKPLAQWWPDGPGPYLAGGLIGVPVGLWILNTLPDEWLMLAFGAFLMAYALYVRRYAKKALFPGPVSWFSAMGVGAAGGLIGGFSAFPSAAVVIWTGMKGMPKGETRGILQPYILTMQFFALICLAIHSPEVFSETFWILLAIMLPIVVPCTLTGISIYKRLSDINFKKVAVAILGVAGLGIFVKGVCSCWT